MPPRLPHITAIAVGLALCSAAWSGYSQQRWINQKNEQIAIAYAQELKRHSNPIWALMGIGGLGAIAWGGVSLKYAQHNQTPSLSTAYSESGRQASEHFLGEPMPRIVPPPAHIQASPNPDPTEWLKSFFSESYHVALNGVTRSGKTTLCEWGIEQLENGEVYLIDPKYNPKNPRWNYTPSCTDIDEVPIHLDKLSMRIKSRLQDNEPSTPLSIIVDEWDWIKDTHGNPVIKSIRKLFKVGAELNIKLWLLGQSPLATGTGLSGSDYRNFGRVVLNAEALAFINNRQFPWDSSRYKLLAESHQRRGERFGLFIPMNGEPFIKVIPDFRQFSVVQSHQPDRSDEPVERSAHTPERSTEPAERDEVERLNGLLEKGSSNPERIKDWEPRDPLNDSEPSSGSIGMVVTLYRSGCTKQEIIEYVWCCKKGGSKSYKKAEEYYEQTLQNLGVKNNGSQQ